ncbi:MAG: maleylpyruvate isomerase N-terminal domain-containing protein [Frankia sp.]
MTEARSVIAAVRRSHENVRALVEPLSGEALRDPSYATEWTIAQVLSHLGSGAEIGRVVLDAAVAGQPSPGQDTFIAIWDIWNAKTPDAQAADALVADRALVERYEALDDDQLQNVRISMGPMELDATAAIGLRLAEHAIHTWDIAVMLDPTATIAEVAVDQLIDGLGMIAGFAGKPIGTSADIHVTTTGPDRDFSLTAGDAVALTAWDAKTGQARLTLPAEAFIRLVYGRLDPAHTPSVKADGIQLDELRAVFPGF